MIVIKNIQIRLDVLMRIIAIKDLGIASIAK